MTTAKEIENMGNNRWALLCAEAMADSTNQDWENEETVYTFADGSKIKFSGAFKEEVI